MVSQQEQVTMTSSHKLGMVTYLEKFRLWKIMTTSNGHLMTVANNVCNTVKRRNAAVKKRKMLKRQQNQQINFINSMRFHKSDASLSFFVLKASQPVISGVKHENPL